MDHTLLLVDDETDNLDALKRHFRKRYQVLTATSGTEALALLKENLVHLIISDQRMPQMSGVEFLKASQNLQPEAVRILLTGYTDIESVIAAINEGHIYRYVTKPWDSYDLSMAVDQALQHYDLHAQLAEKNKSLAAALEDLKTLDQAKSQFMILVNHELKTPLTSITSFLSLLLESTLSEEQELFARRIEQATVRLQKLIDDSLLLISAETGQLPIQKEVHKLSKVVPDLTPEQEALKARRQLQVQMEVPDSKITCDIKVIQQVMGYLLDNALRFAREGSEIKVLAEAINEQWQFRICNQGQDLPPHLIRLVLQPFALNEDIMKHSRGLGLGLSLSQALLKRHNSQLNLKSTAGQIEASFLI